MPGAPTQTLIAGGSIVTPDELIESGTVRLDGRRISAVERSEGVPTDAIDATGQYVLPGFIDVHGDDIERCLAPRPGTRVPMENALRQSDVAAVSAGITTKCHAVAFEDVPEDVRSIDVARDICEAVRDFGPGRDGLADHRLHLRCELTQRRGVRAALAELSRGASLVSLVEHVPGEGQYGNREAPDHRYRTDGASEILGTRRQVSAGTRWDRARRVTATARRMGVPVASHDDPDPDAVARASDLGADVCEFPLTLDAARAADRSDMTVALGAPNVARGRSLYGNLDARRALEAGVVDVLCSDFRPESLVESLFVDAGSLPQRVARVTAEPARTLGLEDRGRIRPGARGDVVVLDPDPVPSIRRVFVAGKEVYRIDR